MLFKEYKGKTLPSLGMGCMRLPGDGYGKPFIEENETEKMIDFCMQNAINYFDTAWGYHGGNSEPTVAKFLQKYPRDSYFLASKFPGYDLSYMGRAEEVFTKQLERCKVDYFDFYLFHNVCETNINEYLDDEKYGDFSYLLNQKQNGRIRHLGFSAHGGMPVMKKFLEAYGEHMEFCQIQLNYLDWEFQDAKAKVELLTSYNIPVWVMEPLRGGKLAVLDDEIAKPLLEARPDESIPSWGFRFLQSIPQVTMVLSGMSNMQQLTENTKIMSEHKPLNETEWSLLQTAAKKITEKTALPCTACGYCTQHCPMELNIPWIVEMYNESCLSTGIVPLIRMRSLAEDKQPKACLHCKACESVCPQQIAISDMMTEFAKKL